MKSVSKAAYAAYLADVRHFFQTHHSASQRFFAMQVENSASWHMGVHKTLAPLPKSPLSKVEQTSALPPPPLPLPVATTSPAASAPLMCPIPIAVTPVPPPPGVAKTSAETPSKQALITPLDSTRLSLQAPPPVHPFAEGEWKQLLMQHAPKIKTCDTPPSAFGESLWGTSATDFAVLFIDPCELDIATERFIKAIQSASTVLFSSIGCLPLHELAAHAEKRALRLSDLALYLKEPLRKKTLWNELERLHNEHSL